VNRVSQVSVTTIKSASNINSPATRVKRSSFVTHFDIGLRNHRTLTQSLWFKIIHSPESYGGTCTADSAGFRFESQSPYRPSDLEFEGDQRKKVKPSNSLEKPIAEIKGLSTPRVFISFRGPQALNGRSKNPLLKLNDLAYRAKVFHNLSRAAGPR